MENIAFYDRINSLPNQVKEEVLDFMELKKKKKRKQGRENKNAEKSKPLPQRKLGLLDNKASFRIKDDFEMADEDLLAG